MERTGLVEHLGHHFVAGQGRSTLHLLPRRTASWQGHGDDVLGIRPHDAEERGIHDGDEVTVASRVGTTTLHAFVSDRMAQGVVYTTFHYPVSGANVVTTEHSDWATNCPEYKVTAVQVSPGHSAATVEIDHPEHRLGALVRMANQIARQMTADPNLDAVAATATHPVSYTHLTAPTSDPV